MTVTNVHETIAELLAKSSMPDPECANRPQEITYNGVSSVGEALLDFNDIPTETITTYRWTWANVGGEGMHLVVTVETNKDPAESELWIEHDEIVVKFGSSLVTVPYFQFRAISFVNEEATRASLRAIVTGGRR